MNDDLCSVHLSRCFNISLTIFYVRPAGELGSESGDPVDDDIVELEKSNILLMGPTGSGNLLLPYLQQLPDQQS